MKSKSPRYTDEFRERAVRMVRETQNESSVSYWGAVESVSSKLGCAAQTLHDWIKRQEIDAGVRAGVSTEERERIKALEREVKELRQANEILRLASAFFAQAELDRLKKK